MCDCAYLVRGRGRVGVGVGVGVGEADVKLRVLGVELGHGDRVDLIAAARGHVRGAAIGDRVGEVPPLGLHHLGLGLASALGFGFGFGFGFGVGLGLGLGLG